MSKSKEITRRQTIQSSDMMLAILMVLFCLIAGKLVLSWQDYKSVREEIDQWNTIMIESSVEGLAEETTLLDDLLMVVDKCVEIFKDENISIRSYNLEGILEEGNSQSYLHSALIRFRLLGSWEGIERGVTRIEGMPNQAIHVEEAVLDQGSGEILLKIYFLEPDNPT